MHPPSDYTAVKRDMMSVLKDLTSTTFFAHTEVMLTDKKICKRSTDIDRGCEFKNSQTTQLVTNIQKRCSASKLNTTPIPH